MIDGVNIRADGSMDLSALLAHAMSAQQVSDHESKRTEDRTAHMSIIKYTQPTLGARAHGMICSATKGIVSAFPAQGEMIEKVLHSELFEQIMAIRKNTAVTVDLSESGLGICMTRPLDPGEDILIYNNRWHNRPVPATVRWCRRHTDLFFRAGLQYTY
jgi:hypothetical protein